MIAKGKERKWHWVAGLILLMGVVTHVILFSLVEIRLGFGPKLEAREPFVRYEKRTEQEDSVLLERAMLFDSEPLFVPTRWNSASDLSEVARLKDETELFEIFGAVLHLVPGSIAGVKEGWLAERKPDLNPENRLNEVMIPPLESLGVREEAGERMRQRGAGVEVYSLGGGGEQEVEGFEIGLDRISGGSLWSPVTYYLVVDIELGVLPPLRTNSTGDEELDNQLMDYLGSEEFRRKIGSGYFRVEVGP